MVATDGKQHEARVMKEQKFPLAPESIVSLDRGYLDFKWLYSLTQEKVYFVTRAKKNFKYQVVSTHKEPKRRSSPRPENTTRRFYSNKDYPKTLRRIEYCDPENNKKLVFLTNNFKLAASTIAAIYKARWQIELFLNGLNKTSRSYLFWEQPKTPS